MAYAALVSLMHILEQLQRPVRHPILQNEEQIDSLCDKISFLQDFLEEDSLRKCENREDMESRIRDAVYAAEDIIESQIVRHIYADSASKKDYISSAFCQHMHHAIESMELIKNEVAKIKESSPMIKDQLHKNFATAVTFRPPQNVETDHCVVGFEEHLIRIVDVLAREESNLEVVSIVGMGGIGKTTLAKKVYDDSFVVEHFYVRAWVTISQEYSIRQILLGLMHGVRVFEGRMKEDRIENLTNEMSGKSDMKLGEMLYKSLYGRRYLIVMDDMWRMMAWDKIKIFLPDNANGSRILVTTRVINLAVDIGSRNPYQMNFLDVDESWKLLCQKVFVQKVCPLELEKIGKVIAINCGGLPLAIDVIGRLLAKSTRTQEYWKYVAKDLNSILSSRSDEHCLNILSLSYKYLPLHLKPCFLYMGMFPEDSEIHASTLIKLWVCEGFLRPIKGKSLEEVAKEYLQDLVDRHLILVRQRGCTRKMKTCSMHDLLRDLCIREAQKENFFGITRAFRLNVPLGIENERRLSVQQSTRERKYRSEVIHGLQSASLARSLVCDCRLDFPHLTTNFRLLRVMVTIDKYSIKDIVRLVNLRYLSCEVDWQFTNSRFPSSIARIWNLQILIVDFSSIKQVVLPLEIWEMTRLRHLLLNGACLPDPSITRLGEKSPCVLENLQTLCGIKNLRCNEKVLKGIPNVTKLAIVCEDEHDFEYDDIRCSHYGRLNNLARLHKLQSLTCITLSKIRPGAIAFPRSLKKLKLSGLRLPWEAMTIIGSLPILEVLKLQTDAFWGPVWVPTEGEFCRLKFLLLTSESLQHWQADNYHFPILERLVICNCVQLEEIPAGVGEIPTLELIELNTCCDSAVASAEEILEEQRSMGNDVLKVRVSGRIIS